MSIINPVIFNFFNFRNCISKRDGLLMHSKVMSKRYISNEIIQMFNSKKEFIIYSLYWRNIAKILMKRNLILSLMNLRRILEDGIIVGMYFFICFVCFICVCTTSYRKNNFIFFNYRSHNFSESAL